MKYYTRLPNSAIADEKKLEKQVAIRLRHFASLALCYVTVKNTKRNGEWGVVTKVRGAEPEIEHGTCTNADESTNYFFSGKIVDKKNLLLAVVLP